MLMYFGNVSLFVTFIYDIHIAKLGD